MHSISLGAQSTTVTVKKTADVAAALVAGKPVLLRAHGIRVPAGVSAIVRVFVGPAADATTPVADARFVGLLTVVAHWDGGDQAPPSNAVLEIPAAARALLAKAGDEFPLALVRASADGSAPPSAPVTIESITVAAQ